MKTAYWADRPEDWPDTMPRRVARCPSCSAIVAYETRNAGAEPARTLRLVWEQPVRVTAAERDGVECWGPREGVKHGGRQVRDSHEVDEAQRRAYERIGRQGGLMAMMTASDYVPWVPDPCDTWCPSCEKRLRVVLAG